LLPLALGATTFIQQKIMPQQMDPAQQKMMTYFMPAVFTAMMLFLPSGLGVYMFTNSILGIAQQLAVERYYASQAQAAASSDVVVRDVTKDDDDENGKKKSGSALGKGDARV
jgi:YidC/Oxa1 family membrane protein insertase